MLKSKFHDFLSFLKDKKILITTHDQVDVDGLVSCTVLKHFLNQQFQDQTVVVYYSEISKPTKAFIVNFTKKFENFSFSFTKSLELSDFDILVILDTNNLDLINFNGNTNLSEGLLPFIFVDHHLNTNKEYAGNKIEFNLISDIYSSTAEIVLEMCEEYSIDLNSQYKSLLISGILTDSGFFKYGNNYTLSNVSKLLDDDLSIQDVMMLLDRDRDISEKIAKIKGLQRVKLVRENDWLIGISHVGSFEGSVATNLVKSGFDVGIVYSEKPDEYVICTRAKKNACLRTQLHLGKILQKISDKYEGSGGGHDGAASLTGKFDLKKVLDEITSRVKENLNNQAL